MSSQLKLMYFDYEDTFYFVDLNKIEKVYLEDFKIFIRDLVSGINLTNPTQNDGLEIDSDGNVQEVPIGDVGDTIGFWTTETGEGAFPYQQSITLENVPASQLLTLYDSDVVYNFEVFVQNVSYQFSDTGANLRTYQDVIDLIHNNSPAVVEFLTMTRNSSFRLKFRSNVAAVGAVDQFVTTLTSSFALFTFANVNQPQSRSTGTNGEFATLTIDFDEPDANQILTNVPLTEEIIFSFSVGSTKNVSVRGFQAETFQDFIDTLNRFDGINALYSKAGFTKNAVFLYSPVPKTPKISDVSLNEAQFQALIDEDPETAPKIIEDAAKLRGAMINYSGTSRLIQIEDFTGLTQNSLILHVLGNSIAGGYTMLDVLQNSKRSNGSYWTEIVPIENDKKSNNEIASQIPEQKLIIDAIEADTTAPEEVKRAMSLDISSIINIGGALAGGSTALKLTLAQIAISKIVDIIQNNYLNVPTDVTTPAEVEAVQTDVIDDGTDSGAFDADGNVVDESLLTPAQKAALVPDPTIIID